MHKRVKRALRLLIFVIVVGSTLLYGYKEAERRSRSSFMVSTSNRTKFSDVYVLIDHTESMSEADVLSAKEIVNNRILSRLGINDTASCYALDGRFKDSTSTVFGVSNQQPPGLPSEEAQKILNLVKAKESLRRPTVCDKATYHLIEQVKAQETNANAKRDDWQNKVTSLQRPAVDGSDYLAALDGINRSMVNYKKQSGRDTWLIIVGDLKNESHTKHPDHADSAFDHILLVYPFNSNDPKWSATEKFWDDYFAGTRYEKYTFAKALHDNSLIAPNPASGFETYEGEGFWHVFWPFLIPVLIVITIFLFFEFFSPFPRVRKHAQVQDL